MFQESKGEEVELSLELENSFEETYCHQRGGFLVAPVEKAVS